MKILTAIALAFVSVGTAGAAPAPEQKAGVDYPGFAALVSEIDAYRAERLIDLDTFLEFAADKDTLILDTRSAAAFAMGHLDGAVNLPFSDFTQEKLDAFIGDKSRRILIYCNNNFSDNIAPLMLKRVELALNIPTFINLYGYGFTNIFELSDVISIEDERIRFVSSL